VREIEHIFQRVRVLIPQDRSAPIDHLRNIGLAALDVGGWMLIVFGRGSR
jgi:hypothetical protein